jgi:hypothetical protein
MAPEYHAILALLNGNILYEEQQRHAAAVRAARRQRTPRSNRSRPSRRGALGRKAGWSR